MAEKFCKYCGTKVYSNGSVCGTCGEKRKLIMRYAVIRNELRRKLNLLPMPEVDAK